jgi:Helix-turn-helix domain
MPKPIPIPVRRQLLQRAQRGEAPATLAAKFGLPARTVRHLLQRFRERGETAVNPDYRAPGPWPQAYSAEVREAALAQRREHPSWGAELIRVALRVHRPELAAPAATTLRRWSRDAGLGPAPRGHRPPMPRAKATRPHETWQIDASERIPLRDGQQVCWLRVVDEASGAVLRTAVFPPSLLEPSASPGHPGPAAGAVHAVGFARATAGGQRHALGLQG